MEEAEVPMLWEMMLAVEYPRRKLSHGIGGLSLL